MSRAQRLCARQDCYSRHCLYSSYLGQPDARLKVFTNSTAPAIACSFFDFPPTRTAAPRNIQTPLHRQDPAASDL
ncbi:hypothetical protein MCOR25_004732 [Pyricularia grisea]|nr:hypothetical protein MCOR25_004732 [Pyricularia grisea]